MALRTAGERVLIIDDNVSLAENIAEILQMAGYLTDVASSAEEALPKALAEQPAVVVTDYRLPGENGVELVKKIRRTYGQVRAVVISGYADERAIREAQEAGAAFLPKPVDLSALSRLITGADST
jgi:DNA-binding NtrC family response regulator